MNDMRIKIVEYRKISSMWVAWNQANNEHYGWWVNYKLVGTEDKAIYSGYCGVYHNHELTDAIS